MRGGVKKLRKQDESEPQRRGGGSLKLSRGAQQTLSLDSRPYNAHSSLPSAVRASPLQSPPHFLPPLEKSQLCSPGAPMTLQRTDRGKARRWEGEAGGSGGLWPTIGIRAYVWECGVWGRNHKGGPSCGEVTEQEVNSHRTKRGRQLVA